MRALRAYERYNFTMARRLTASALYTSPNPLLVLVHVGALWELNEAAALFKVAHELAQRCGPHDARALYALGTRSLLCVLRALMAVQAATTSSVLATTSRVARLPSHTPTRRSPRPLRSHAATPSPLRHAPLSPRPSPLNTPLGRA